MIIRDYRIELRRLSRHDIELVRNWRNSPRIREHMFFRDEITSEQQSKWFDSIDNELNFYWLIFLDRHPHGLINTSDINLLKGEAYSGLFIYSLEWIQTQLPALASLCMLEFNFEVLKLKAIKAKVRKENQVALKYNQSLGFEVEEEIGDDGLLLTLKRNVFETKTQELRGYMRKKFPDGPEIELLESDKDSIPELYAFLKGDRSVEFSHRVF